MFGELRYYDDEYVFGSSESFDDIDIYYSIYVGYPVYGIFYNASNVSREHAGTIYSCNIIAGRMSVMDPYSVAHTATMNSQSGTYSYYSTPAGVTYHLYYAFLRNE